MMGHFKFGGFPHVILAAVALMFGSAAVVGAENAGRVTTLEARLILASDKATGPPVARKLDTASMKRFYCFYKWTNFFLVKKQRFAVAALATRKVSMTDSCQVQVRDLGAGRLECKLFRDGKLLGTQTSTLTSTGRVIFGGDTSDNNAWFVSLRFPLESSPASTSEAQAKQTGIPLIR